MQQVVDLQRDKAFQNLGIQLLAISPDPVERVEARGRSIGHHRSHALGSGEHSVDEVRDPWLDDSHNEPGHTFFLVGGDGKIAWLRDYGAPEHGGAMYVAPKEVISQVQQALAGP